ncbi:MAG: 30S ribosomal protein S1 [Nitrospiraceae bacterium]|nr:30S ribosomal protein S1 [Nitrospiraceae bacterium]
MEFSNNDLERLYSETLHTIHQGSILKGKVIGIKKDGVLVDIGYKSDGFIPAEEFSINEFAELKEGCDLIVCVEKVKNITGMINLSRKASSKMKSWVTIESAFSSGTPVEGIISGKTKGGFSVNLSGINAFLPGSQINLKTFKGAEDLINKKLLFKVLKANSDRLNVIVSNKAVVGEDGRLVKKAEIIERLKEGAVITGKVKNITDYGVFVDMGGIDGLLHISDISWSRIKHPSSIFKIGEKIEVVVLKYDKEHNRVSLGYKQKHPDPWLTIENNYNEGKKVMGKIVNITEYGLFIEIEEGLEGLVHQSEIDWSSNRKHPSKYFSLGDVVETIILNINKKDRRISLSIKRSKPNPWDLVAQRYKIGQTINGRISSITEFGAFVGLPEGVDGLVHVSDISWTKHIKHPSEKLRKGQDVDTVVLNIEPEKEKITLGIKQLTPDPWLNDIPKRFRLGDILNCKIINSTEFGLFVQIEDSFEGLIYASEVVRQENPFKEGDILPAKIMKIDLDKRKIGLSMKTLIAITEVK